MKYENTLYDRLLHTVRNNPGITGTEIRDLFQEIFQSKYSNYSISSTLGRIQKNGLIENRGPAGTRWSQWYPIEFGTVDPKFMKMAQTLIIELNKIPPTQREIFLARYLQNLKIKSRRKW